MFTGIFGSLTTFKKYGKYVLLVLVLGGCFFLGRCTAPTKTVTQTVIVKEQVESKVTQNEETKTQIQYVDRPVDHVITKIIVKEPGGKTTVTTTDATHTGNTVVTKSEDAKVQTKTEIKTEIVYQDKIIEKLVLKNDFKRWEVGLGAGYKLAGDSVNLIPVLPKKLVIEGEVDYSLTDWFSVGVFASTETVIGAKVGVKF